MAGSPLGFRLQNSLAASIPFLPSKTLSAIYYFIFFKLIILFCLFLVLGIKPRAL
jgi:hypothetical protein